MRRLVVEIFTGERMSSAAKNDPAIVQIFKEIKSLELLTILKRSESGAEFIVRITFKNPEYEIEKFSLFERMEFQILETDLTNGTYILFLKTKFVNKSKEDRHGTEIPDFFVTGLKYDNGTVKISLLGLIGGGLLASFNWHYVFLINVPFGIAGSLWSLLKLKDTIARKKVRMDIPGNISLGGGLVAISLGFTYALVPYHSSSMGWMNPWVIIAFIAGIVLLISFIFIEMRVKSPLFQLQLFKNKSFALGNFAYFLYTLGRMGVMFLLVIWLQGIYLPLHGVSYSNTPIRTGIMLLPLLGGMIALAPVGGKLADRYGPTIFATAAMIIIAASLYLLTLLPLNFNLLEFELILFVNGIGLGLFVAPNSLRIMNALPAESRGVGSGIRTTFGNIAGTISMAIFFSITITVFDRGLPGYLYSTGVSIGLPTYVATVLSNISPEGILFATFMGINPMSGLPHSIIALIPAGALKILMSTTFFPATIGHSFLSGFRFSVYIGIIITLIGTVLSAFAGKAKHDRLEQQGGDGGKTK